jgi:hypothetical protein
VKLRKFKVVVGEIVVAAKDYVKYLGCVPDNHLTGEIMAQNVITKVNHKIRFLARTSKYLDKNAMWTLAGALVQCHFDYACSS